MSISVVLAVPSSPAAHTIEDLLEGDSGVAVRAVATSPESLLAAVLDHEPDAVLLHEDFGPAPALAVARDLVGRLPWVSIVLLTRDASVDRYASAVDAGIRSLVALPPSHADLMARLTAGAWWSRTVRHGSEARNSQEDAGTVLAVVGGKGGVGTTTIASQLAFVAAGPRERRVCLVDLDLYGANLAPYLAATASRSIRELVDLSNELSPAVVQPVLYPHESGVRVLFAPEDVTEAELVTASVVRRVIGVLRAMFDVVVLDCGSQVLEASLPAIEIADRVVLITTPDLLAVRAAHRMVETWQLLDVRRPDTVELVLNRVSRAAAVQPRLVGQTAAMPVCRIHLPAAFGAMEPLANEGASGLRHQRSLARPLSSLARHFGLLPPQQARFTPLWRWRSARATVTDGDQGSLPAEVATMWLVLTVGLLLTLQLLFVGWAGMALAVLTPTAADSVAEGADVEDVEEDLRELGGLLRRVTVEGDGDRVVVSVPVPMAVPLPGAEPRLSSDAEVLTDGGDDAPAAV